MKSNKQLKLTEIFSLSMPKAAKILTVKIIMKSDEIDKMMLLKIKN